jgi:hypothetical protein
MIFSAGMAVEAFIARQAGDPSTAGRRIPTRKAVGGERHSRSIIYRADLSRFREVALFLLKDCCGGRHASWRCLLIFAVKAMLIWP